MRSSTPCRSGVPFDEVLRVLDALRSGGVCPASWTAADGTLDIDAMLQPGRVLGHYRVEQPLGRGGCGVVLKAWDLKLRRPVAVKVLHREIRSSRQLLLAEAQAAAAINHPNVCTVFAAEEIDGLPVVIMELLEGRTLTDVVREGPSQEQAEALAHKIALGLAAAHRQLIVHGDLKPANILLSYEGEPVIADFGLARSQRPADVGERAIADELGAAAETARIADLDPEATVDYPDPLATVSAFGRGGLTGTPAYMAPEQARGERATPASDVFSLALILFELWTGRRALQQPSLIALVEALRDDQLGTRLAQLAPSPRRRLLELMLSADPQARPTMQQVLEHW